MDYFTYLRGMDYQMQSPAMSGNYQYMTMPNIDMGGAAPWPLTFQSKSTQYNLNELITGVKNSVGNEKDNVYCNGQNGTKRRTARNNNWN